MGTTVWVDGGSAEAVASWFEEVEACCSRFRDDSELSRLNAHPPGWVDVSPLLAGLLTASAEMLRRTGGLVDPAVGAAVQGWGYDRSFELVGIDQPRG